MPADGRARSWKLATLTLAGLLLAACAGPQGASPTASPNPRPLPSGPAQWLQWRHVTGVFDLAGPLTDGTMVVAGSDGLSLVNGTVGPSPVARGNGGWAPPPGGAEAYIATGALTTPGIDCPPTIGSDVYALRLTKPLGIDVVDVSPSSPHPTQSVADLSGLGFESLGGIAGPSPAVGGRLVVTGARKGKTIVATVDCTGKSTLVTDQAPTVEGGIAIAPAGFGKYGGQLVAPDETTGKIYAISQKGEVSLVATSTLPVGGDIGVESIGFVPAGFLERGGYAYAADRATPGNPHPGTDSILRLDAPHLAAAGVRDGDMLVATEGGDTVEDVSCGATGCGIRVVATGPSSAHGEGHVVFAAGGGGGGSAPEL